MDNKLNIDTKLLDTSKFNNLLKVKTESIYAVAKADIPITAGDVTTYVYYLNIYVKHREDPIMVPYEKVEDRDLVFERYKF